MDGTPRLLLWNYSEEELTLVSQVLEAVKAPPAVPIRKDQGYLLLKEIIHTDKRAEQEFECDEKVILFYNIPNKGMSFLIDLAKRKQLPVSIYASVTEHSIEWPFNELVEELVTEREAFRQAAKQNEK